MKNVLLTLLAVVLLVVFAAATPWPCITDEAHSAHIDMLWN